jgi:hypothetical protein
MGKEFLMTDEGLLREFVVQVRRNLAKKLLVSLEV